MKSSLPNEPLPNPQLADNQSSVHSHNQKKGKTFSLTYILVIIAKGSTEYTRNWYKKFTFNLEYFSLGT